MVAERVPYILAIDLGTSGAKVALVSIHGEVVGWEFEPVQLFLLPNGGAEQDPEEWWRSILTASKRLLAKEIVPRAEIVGVCAATTGVGTIPVDRDGKCLMRAIIWLDSRGAHLTRKYVRGLINVEGYDVFRVLRWIRLTGGAPSLSGKDLVGHFLYLKDELPDVYQKAHKLLDVVDYIDFRLTGEYIATSDTIALSWVADNRNPGKVSYDDGLIREWGLDRSKLPEIKRCIDVIGNLRKDVAEELGLRSEVKVVAGGFDLPFAAVGAGAVENFAAHLSLATSSFLTVHVPFKKTDLFHMIASLPCAIPDRYLLLAEQEVAAGNLVYFRDKVLYWRDGLAEVEKPSGYFQALNQVAAESPPGSNGVIYSPWLYGERAPVEDPWIRAAFHNLSLQTSRSDMVRAMLEGVAFNTRWILAPVEKFCGRAVNPINLAGGGGNSNLWCQIHADVLGRTIRQVENPIQAVARGAAFVASVGLGHIDFSDVSRLIKFQGIYEPNPANRPLYDERFEIFLELYKQNKKIYERLNRPRR
jgi:xylulokinase